MLAQLKLKFLRVEMVEQDGIDQLQMKSLMGIRCKTVLRRQEEGNK